MKRNSAFLILALSLVLLAASCNLYDEKRTEYFIASQAKTISFETYITLQSYIFIHFWRESYLFHNYSAGIIADNSDGTDREDG